MGILQKISDAAKGKVPLSMKRSDEWPKVRASHLKDFPACALCDGTDKVEVHHIAPFHIHPDMELAPLNLITLCESDSNGVNCHLFCGHLGNFKSFNVNVGTDAAMFKDKLKNRPSGE